MQEYEYYYDGAEFYCYPETGVLINKLHIRDDEKLDEIERELTFTKGLDLEVNPVIGKFDFAHFCEIHRRLFAELYEWAGIPRKGGFMSKGKTLFAHADYIEGLFNEYYEKLTDDNFLKGFDKAEFCEKLAYYMAKMNAIHPFREGNGRTMKIYFKQLSANAGYDLDFKKAPKDDLLLADVLAYNKNYNLSIDILNQITTQI